MKKLLVLTLMFVVWAMAASPVTASLTLVSVDGAWSNPVGGMGMTGIEYFDGQTPVPDYGNHKQDQIRWGTPYLLNNSSGFKSGLGFTGNVGGPITEGVAFETGQLVHFNYEIETGTNATAVDLGITLTFAVSDSQTSTFTFQINETPKIGSPDIISFPSSIASEVMEIGGVMYKLEILGFGLNAGSTLDEFSSDEGAENATLLWAKINVIPAPAAILLAGIGTAMVGWLRRKRAV